MSFLRCANCHLMWRADVNILNDTPYWFPPKKKPKGCKHDAGVEVWNGTAWDVRPLVAS